MAVSVLVVQHAEKQRLPGDPGLTSTGRRQAEVTAAWLAGNEAPVALYASPLRRARETAAPISERLRLGVRLDARLRERMNWDDPDLQSFEEFLDDWNRASQDRAYVPSVGDSSEQAGRRFLDVLTDVAAVHDGGTVVIVAHGGVTVDLLRTLVGDGRLRASHPRLIEEGVPCCGITRLRLDDVHSGWAESGREPTDRAGWVVAAPPHDSGATARAALIESVGWTGHLAG